MVRYCNRQNDFPTLNYCNAIVLVCHLVSGLESVWAARLPGFDLGSGRSAGAHVAVPRDFLPSV